MSMSEQREMTLDEYLDSKLPEFHLARRQLQELREERDTLAATVKELREALEDSVNCLIDNKLRKVSDGK